MAKVLYKPYTARQRAELVVHYTDKEVVETDLALYVLEPWEYVENDQVISDREAWAKRKAEAIKEAQKLHIIEELDKLDLKSIRAIRAGDQDYIAQYEAQAQELRRQLQELQ